ncbi:hypothetical protein AcW1_002445 [Taiwanofungus camphoratus]|nr:hypothetical protein AcW1_002445 [Antrodia cinnamomea]
MQACLLGLKSEAPKEPGHAWLAPCVRNASGKMKQSPSVAWSETLSSTIHRHTQGQPIHHQAIIDMVIYHKAIAFTACDSDKVMLNDFVLFSDDKNSIVSIGQIKEVLVPADSNQGGKIAAYVAIQKVEFLPLLHVQLRVPCLRVTTRHIVLSVKDVICGVNVQHDCSVSGCKETSKVPVWQENLETRKM